MIFNQSNKNIKLEIIKPFQEIKNDSFELKNLSNNDLNDYKLSNFQYYKFYINYFLENVLIYDSLKCFIKDYFCYLIFLLIFLFITIFIFFKYFINYFYDK